jgi:hypothetical protein
LIEGAGHDVSGYLVSRSERRKEKKEERDGGTARADVCERTMDQAARG